MTDPRTQEDRFRIDLVKLIKATLFDLPPEESGGATRATPGTEEGLSTKVANAILDDYRLVKKVSSVEEMGSAWRAGYSTVELVAQDRRCR